MCLARKWYTGDSMRRRSCLLPVGQLIRGAFSGGFPLYRLRYTVFWLFVNLVDTFGLSVILHPSKLENRLAAGGMGGRGRLLAWREAEGGKEGRNGGEKEGGGEGEGGEG